MKTFKQYITEQENTKLGSTAPTKTGQTWDYEKDPEGNIIEIGPDGKRKNLGPNARPNIQNPKTQNPGQNITKEPPEENPDIVVPKIGFTLPTEDEPEPSPSSAPRPTPKAPAQPNKPSAQPNKPSEPGQKPGQEPEQNPREKFLPLKKKKIIDIGVPDELPPTLFKRTPKTFF